MKLASLAHGRDGRLVVVSRDLTRATDAFPVVATLQAALDDWPRFAPRLADLAEGLEHGSVPSFRFHEHDCAAPLPRAYRRLLLEGEGPLLDAAGDASCGPRQAVRLAGEEGSTCQAGLAMITGDLPVGATLAQATAAIRLLLLSCQVKQMNRPGNTLNQTLNDLNQTGNNAAQAVAMTQAVPALTLSPVAVTLDEIDSAKGTGPLELVLQRQLNGQATPVTVRADLAAVLVAAARHRGLTAGTVVEIVPSLPQPSGLRFGDTVRVAMKDGAGHSVFGAIEQEIMPEA